MSVREKSHLLFLLTRIKKRSRSCRNPQQFTGGFRTWLTVITLDRSRWPGSTPQAMPLLEKCLAETRIELSWYI
jgi:hypothetical protein